MRKNQVLSKIGRAFEKGLQSEEESEVELEEEEEEEDDVRCEEFSITL